MNKDFSINDKIRANLRLMKVGDVYSWPAAKLYSVRVSAYVIGSDLGWKFKVTQNQLTKRVEVARLTQSLPRSKNTENMNTIPSIEATESSDIALRKWCLELLVSNGHPIDAKIHALYQYITTGDTALFQEPTEYSGELSRLRNMEKAIYKHPDLRRAVQAALEGGYESDKKIDSALMAHNGLFSGTHQQSHSAEEPLSGQPSQAYTDHCPT